MNNEWTIIDRGSHVLRVSDSCLAIISKGIGEIYTWGVKQSGVKHPVNFQGQCATLDDAKSACEGTLDALIDPAMKDILK